jgi:acetyl esterase/lipase
MGDSAGGNFALILAQQIKKNKLKTVKNVILISPALSFEKTKEVYDDFDDEVIMTRRFLYTCQE